MKNFPGVQQNVLHSSTYTPMEREGIEMDYDKGKEARVWQRIQNEKQQEQAARPAEHLPALIMECLQLAAAYRQLSLRVGGKDGTSLIRLAREANAQAVCLKGIVSLMKGSVPNITGIPQQLSITDVLMRRCYGAELRMMKACESRCSDPEYGPVFERLTARGREHCCTLMELIGRTGKFI